MFSVGVSIRVSVRFNVRATVKVYCQACCRFCQNGSKIDIVYFILRAKGRSGPENKM